MSGGRGAKMATEKDYLQETVLWKIIAERASLIMINLK